MNPLTLTISEIAELLRTKQLSPVELTTATLQRIEQLNPELNAFITITSELALEQAQAAEEEIQRGDWRGPLHGVPIGIKDLIDTAGIRTTCGSAVFAARVPTEDAFVVQRLKQAGAVIVGKQNLQEFAWGGTSASSHFGPVRNPWDQSRIAGGSSGGSAAAVAAQMCFAAIGTDTGGSVREPASFCGVVGLKPTYGRVSTRGVFPLSWSLDHVGPLGRSVKDVAIMMDGIAGYDEKDPYCVDRPVDDYSAVQDKTDVRIGVARSPYFEDLDPDISVVMEQALKVVANLAVAVTDVELPPVPAAVQAGEVLAIHARNFSSTPELYRPFMRERMKQATEIQTLDYVQDLHQLHLLRHTINSLFSEVDLIVTPTVPVGPILVDDAVDMSPPPPPGELWLRNTRPFNAYGLPTISVPCGSTSKGLPVGLQIAGPMFGESKVLAFAHAFEQTLRLCG
jgi:aspartyl-tRNA(Asn)/glutamyl-tRNA(Gln) amidotransferase subunit A